MSFEKTRQLSEGHTDEDLKNDEESTGTDQPEEETDSVEEDTSLKDDSDEEEESVESLKERLAKAEADRDNYKQGMLSAKGKNRTISKTEEPKQESTVDVDEEKVLKTIYKVNEQKVLRDVINPSSKNYMPELVPDDQYKEIVNYLPRNIDRSSDEGIVRALKLAVNSWKYDKGDISKDEYTKGVKDGVAKAKTSELASTQGVSSQGKAVKKEKKTGRKILTSGTTPSDWY